MAIKITENSLGAGAGGGSTSNLGNSKSSTEKQSAVIYDMLSEGPIEGLVNGAASIYLDSTAVMEGGNNRSFGATNSTDVSYTASTGVIVDNNGSLFSSKDVTEGTYYIKIHKAGKSATVATTAGLNIITATSSVFAATDVTTLGGGLSIHIPGAGPGGNDYIGGISRFISATQVQVFNPPRTTTSGKAAKVDLVSTIGTIQSSAQATLSSTGLGINAANVTAFVQTPTQIATSTPKYNFENTAVAFRTGTRDQSYLRPPVGLGSAAIVYNASTELEQTDLSGLSGIGSTPNEVAGWDDIAEPTATRTANRVTASTMGVTEPGEVDQISISINFPSGIFAHKPKSGTEGPAQAEFLVDFDYSKDGSTYTTTRILGRSDSQLAAAGINMGSPNVNQGGNGMVRAHTRTPFTKSFSFDIEKYQPFVDYRVNIQRVNVAQGEHGGFNHTSTATLQAIQNIIEDKLSYPLTAYGAVILDAQNFSGLPTRGYELRGLKVKVPTNYHPRHELSEGAAASYTRHITNGSVQSSAQDWDGNFRGDLHTFTTGVNVNTVYTDNPVWVLLDVMTNDRYGLGKFIDPEGDFAMIDKFQLYQIAKYCDELVPDGKGGQEPRFTCNMYITELAEAQRYLSDLIGIFRGMLVYFNGKIAPQVNRKKSPIYSFTKGNVIDGTFSYQSSSKRFRSNQIRVTWNNPEAFFRQDVEVVEDIENILETNRIVPNEVVAMGCTSQGQAHRYGKWILLTEKMSTEVVTFGTGLNAAHLKPGDLIEVQDSDIYTTQSAGRVDSGADSTTTVVRLDRAVDLSASGTNFDLNLVYPTGGAYLAEDYAVISGVTYERGDLILAITSQTAAANAEDASGNSIQVLWSEYSRIETQPVGSYSSNVVTVSTAFSAVPNAEVMWSITATTQATGQSVASAPKSFQIASISEDSNTKSFSITGTEYSDNLYDLVERGYVIEQVPDIRKPPVRTDIIPVPTTLGLSGVVSGAESQSEDVDANTTGLDLLIGWRPPVSEVSGSTKKYEHIGGYELKIIGLEEEEGKSEKVIKLGPNNTGHRIKGVRPGVVITVFLRLVTTTGFFSKYIKDEIELVASKLPLKSVPQISLIPKGGVLNKALTINTSTVSISNYAYQYDAPDGTTYSNSTNSAACYQQNFNGMGASAVAYLLFDASESSDKLKAVQFVENTTAVTALGDKLGIQYWKEAGASNNGLTAASGTVSMAVSTNIVIGSGTSFTSQFAVGDTVFIGSGSSLLSATINSITSNTIMNISVTTTRAYSGVAVLKLSFVPNFNLDAILAKVITDSSTNYSISETYAITAGLDGAAGGGVDARTVKLSASNFVIRYDNGSPPAESESITLSAVVQGNAATPTFDYFKSVNQGASFDEITTKEGGADIAATDASFVLADGDEPALDGDVQIRVRMYEGGTHKATDTITLFSIQDGAGGIGGVTGNLTNAAHTVSTASNGATNGSGFYSDAGGVFETFVGATAVSSNSSVLFYTGTSGTSLTSTQNGATFTLTQATGAYALTGSSWNTNAETFTVRALIPASVHGGTGTKTLTRKYTISKSKAGVTPADGDDGLRTIQGYLYQEKTSSGAPGAPSGNTYTFSSGVVTGSGISTATNQPNNVWLNSPNTQDVTSSNIHYTVRYFGTESSAESSTISVTYSAVAQLSSFSGVVTFSNGAFNNGSNITTIDGSNITTGTLSSANLSGTSDGSAFTSAGTRITLSNGAIASKKFRIDSSGNATFAGALSAASGSFAGSLSSVSGTFTGALSGGTISIGSSNSIFKADSNGIQLGHATFASAPFRVSPAGLLNAQSATLGSTSGVAVNVGTGTNTVKINTPSGTGTVFSAGGTAAQNHIPLQVLNDGTGTLQGFNILTKSGTKLFDAETGFTDSAFSGIAQTTGTPLSTISKTIAAQADADGQKVVLTATQSLTIKIRKSSDMQGFDTSANAVSALANALADIPDTVVLSIRHNTSNSFSGSSLLGTVTFTKISSGNSSSVQFRPSSEQELEPGFNFAHTSIIRGDHTNSNSITTDNFFEKSVTHSAGSGDHYYWAVVAGTGGNGVGNNRLANGIRTIEVTAASGETFLIGDDGGTTENSDADITSVTVNAGTGLTGGGTTTVGAFNKTLNVIGGTGITANANDIAITDNGVGATQLNVSGNGSTSQFLRSDGDGTFTWATPTDSNTQLSTEAVQDIVGAMLVGTETRIGVSYDDTNGRINFVVDDMTANTNTQLSNAQVRAAVAAATDSQVFTDADHSKLNGITAGATSYTSNQATNNNSNVKFDGLRVGDTTAAPANTIQCTGDVVAFASSDRRLKDNLTPITNSLEKINKLTGYEFDWNDKQDVHIGRDIGIVAQEVEEVLPEIVETRTSGYKAVKYEKLTALLINAVNDLTQEVKDLKEKLDGTGK